MAKNLTPRVNGLKADASAAPGSFPRLMADFRLWMQVRNMSPHTSAIRLQSVGLFAVFLADPSVFRPCDVNRPMVEAYQRSLTRHIKANGHPMAPIDTPTTNVTAPTETATTPYTGNLDFRPAAPDDQAIPDASSSNNEQAASAQAGAEAIAEEATEPPASSPTMR